MESFMVVVFKGSQGSLVTTCPYPQNILKIGVGIKAATPAKKPWRNCLALCLV